ncbi:uncharacterized protein LOC117607694 isoform X2 [Osmia lignaria lignaria]|uniref:uncharacterized protein LOC117607694 isoform X2 n=1 Tax=Osmia lignaria lignaria TaxID=1437193 RepID=UPI00147907E7|nr:uncharacterized protein LOC117607694 isoform X2 [Osmia lignaria]
MLNELSIFKKNLVRQTINVVPENNEDTIKFHQMIYEKWYFKRSFKSRSTKCDQNRTKPRITSEQNISSTAAYHKSRQSKHRINQSSHEIQRTRTNVENVLQNNLNLPQNVECLFLRNNVPDSNNSHLDEVQLFSIEPTKLTVPVLALTIKLLEFGIAGNNESRGQKIPGTTSSMLLVHAIVTLGYYLVEVLERQRKTRKKLITFEAWKRSKSIEHRKILKQLEKERHNAFITLENTKREMAIREAHIRYKRQQQYQRAQMYSDKFVTKSNCEQIKGKRVKFDKVKAATSMTTRKSNNKDGNRKKQTTSTQNSPESVIFYAWLDQLNWVLHKKYLRERRHLVRSFYCQPLYYGDTTLYVT